MAVHITTDHSFPANNQADVFTCTTARLWDILLPLALSLHSTLSGRDHLAACHLAGVARGQVAAPRLHSAGVFLQGEKKFSRSRGAAAGTTTRRQMT
jgi:hypothetical protein